VGAAVPWFESLGLKDLFGISLINKTVRCRIRRRGMTRHQKPQHCRTSAVNTRLVRVVGIYNPPISRLI